jgi:hypothetical protein
MPYSAPGYGAGGLGDYGLPPLPQSKSKSDDFFQFIVLGVGIAIDYAFFFDNVFFLSAVILVLEFFLLPHPLFGKWGVIGLLALFVLIPLQQVFLLYLLSYALTFLAGIAFILFLTEEAHHGFDAIGLKP